MRQYSKRNLPKSNPDHIKTYHVECGRWNHATSINASRRGGYVGITVEALCFHCDTYYHTKLEHEPNT